MQHKNLIFEHDDLVDYINVIGGYNTNLKWICFGFANMAGQAMLAGQYKTKFVNRFKLLNENLPEVQLQKINSIKEKLKRKIKLNSNEKKLIEVPALFEGMVLYHHTAAFRHALHMGNNVAPQDARAASLFTTPLTLEPQRGAGHSESDEEEKGGIYFAQQFFKNFNPDEFSSFLDAMRQKFHHGTQPFLHPFVLIISSSKHSVCVGCDPADGGLWMFANVDEFSEELTAGKDIGRECIEAFSDNGIGVCTIDLYVAENHREELSEEIIQWLKEQAVIAGKSPRFYDKAKDSEGGSLIFCAAQSGNLKVVKTLLEMGVEPDNARDDGLTPLFIAAQNGHYEIVQLLLKFGADAGERSVKGASPLHQAVLYGHEKIVKKLLPLTPDFDRKLSGVDDVTALYIAVDRGYFHIVKMLLNAGADPNKINVNGDSPYEMAVKNQNKEIIILIEHVMTLRKMREEIFNLRVDRYAEDERSKAVVSIIQLAKTSVSISELEKLQLAYFNLKKLDAFALRIDAINQRYKPTNAKRIRSLESVRASITAAYSELEKHDQQHEDVMENFVKKITVITKEIKQSHEAGSLLGWVGITKSRLVTELNAVKPKNDSQFESKGKIKNKQK